MIECVANVCEGRDGSLVAQFEQAILKHSGVSLLHCDPGADANRTVFTFVGDENSLPEVVAALVETALLYIDMRHYSSIHPHIGAIDVVPFVPLGGNTLRDCVRLARYTGELVARRFSVPVYLYAKAANSPERSELKFIRKGGYASLAERMNDEKFTPDFGPRIFMPEFGALAIGARPVMLAYNVTLASSSIVLAQKIAAEIRGLRSADPQHYAGLRALAWLLPERKLTQISMNLFDYQRFGLFKAYDMVTEVSARYGVKVLGSELIGMAPLNAFVGDAAMDSTVSNACLRAVVEDLGLDLFGRFQIENRVIEFALQK